MAYARAVTFEGVDKSRMDELAKEIREGEPPEGIPASEIVHVPDDGFVHPFAVWATVKLHDGVVRYQPTA